MFSFPGQIWKIIKNLPNNRFPGIYGINNHALKYFGCNVDSYLCHVYNWCARKEYFSPCWKHAEVVMLPQPGKDVLKPFKHLPISLLNTMVKIFEHLLLIKLQIFSIRIISSFKLNTPLNLN